MAKLSVITFQNCSSAIEDIQDPEGTLQGRAFVIIDNDSGEIYKFPMPLDVAKLQGQRLMGIGNVEVVNGNALAGLVKPPERGKTMTWNLAWEGRATDFVPDLLQATGKPGPVAHMAKDAIWEAVQKAGERDSQAWVIVKANGWETPNENTLGVFNLSLTISLEPGEIQQKIAAQQPVDLRS